MNVKRFLSLMLSMCLLASCFALNGCTKEPADDTATPTTVPANKQAAILNPDAKPIDGANLVVFGDSLTAGGTWPIDVAKANNMYVYNAAVGGINTKEAQMIFKRSVEPREADFVTLCFGMNDLLMAAKNRPQVSLEDFKTNMETLCDKIVAKGATPLLMTSSFLDEKKFYKSQNQRKKNYEDVGGPLAWLDQYNDVTRQIAKERGYDLIDIRKACDAYTPEEFLAEDGIHLGEIGNRVYTEEITKYLRAHFRVDPNAEKIVTLFPSVSSPAEPAVTDIVSYDAADWTTNDETTMVFKTNDKGELLLSNTDGKWPDAHYVADKSLYVPFEGTEFVFDFSTAGAGTSFRLFFNGSTPNAYSENQWVNISDKLGAEFDPASGDILAKQDCKGSIPLSELGIPKEAIDEKGNIMISGVKVYVAGARNQPVTIRQFALSTKGAPNK